MRYTCGKLLKNQHEVDMRTEVLSIPHSNGIMQIPSFPTERIKMKGQNSMKNKHTKKITYAALCLALAMVLPFLTGQIPQIGKALSPMHIGAFLCGFLCGWPYGLLIGFVAPLLRSAVFSMPVMFPDAVGMAFELGTYGFLSGLLYKILPKTTGNIYVTLLCSMVVGRIIWGIARFIIAGLTSTQFPFSVFIAGAVTKAIPGMILHIILVPLIIIALKKAKVIPNDEVNSNQ